MVDAVDFDGLAAAAAAGVVVREEELADVSDGVGLVDVGVGGEEVAFGAGAAEDFGEFGGRVGSFV